ncbi:MAG: stage V sporulation protein AD, partial [Clostridiales bacterium]|nr:stage V sporulation protein AD [Clostridiales bacterium]
MGIIKFKSKPVIIASASVVAKKEFDGPLGNEFDMHDDTLTFGMDTWEKAGSEMQS